MKKEQALHLLTFNESGTHAFPSICECRLLSRSFSEARYVLISHEPQPGEGEHAVEQEQFVAEAVVA